MSSKGIFITYATCSVALIIRSIHYMFSPEVNTYDCVDLDNTDKKKI